MSNVKKTMMAAAGGAEYWFLEWGNSSGGTVEPYESSPAVDSNGNFIVGNTLKNMFSSDNDAFVTSIAPDGTINWNLAYGASGDVRGRTVVVDSSDNIYQVGQYYSSSDGYSHREFVTKTSSSGANQWKKFTGDPDASNQSPTGHDMCIDSSGNLYTVAKQSKTGYADLAITKYNSSGTIQWSRTMARGTNLASEFTTITVDNNGRGYAAGYEENVNGSYNLGNIRCFNTSNGVGVWERFWQYSSGSYGLSNIFASDSDGTDVFMGGWQYNNNVYASIISLDASATFAENWAILFSEINFRIKDLVVANDGYIYALGWHQVTQDAIVVKVDKSNGSIQWSRKIDHDSSATNLTYIKGIAHDGNDAIYIWGYGNQSGNYNPWAARLPSDGSLTGTFGDYQITNPSYTVSTYTSYYGSFTYSDPTWSPDTGTAAVSDSFVTPTLNNLTTA